MWSIIILKRILAKAGFSCFINLIYNPILDEANVKNVAEIKVNTTPGVATATILNPIDGQPIA